MAARVCHDSKPRRYRPRPRELFVERDKSAQKYVLVAQGIQRHRPYVTMTAAPSCLTGFHVTLPHDVPACFNAYPADCKEPAHSERIGLDRGRSFGMAAATAAPFSRIRRIQLIEDTGTLYDSQPAQS